MAVSVRLDNDFVTEARAHADAESRSLPKQIEYWANIGKIMMDNPDLSYDFVRETLLAKHESTNGLMKKYERSTPRS